MLTILAVILKFQSQFVTNPGAELSDMWLETTNVFLSELDRTVSLNTVAMEMQR